MSDRLDRLDYYTLLGVEPDASADAIRSAYHAFALKFHPDRHVGGSERKTMRAAMIFRRGAEAYRILADPQLRRDYDRLLPGGELRMSVAPARPNAAPRTNVAPMPARARAFYQKALQHQKQGDVKQALLNAKIALGHAPSHPQITSLVQDLEAAKGS